MIMRVRFLFGLAWTWIVAAFADAQTPQVGSGEPFFGREVLPILQANCFKCHGDQGVKGRLSLFSRAAMLKGGASGPAILLERPDESRLLKAINHQDDLAMPPGGKLTQKEITILTRWVKDGAPWPDHIVAKMPATERGLKITQEDRAYWAYQPVKRPAVPAVKEKAWVRNPIDAFILAKLEGKDLAAASPADRLALARRLYYDVIGLPPTPEEIDAFIGDKADDAYERLIDKLLDRPQYGEKWARHWLDIVRYAETNGFEFDQPKPFAWRYRDYVINAFNKDKPYDQFLREQIAGDLLDPVTPESLIATGYYRLGQWDSGVADRLLQKYDVLDGIVSTTSQAFLGMSIGCARCHDHKKDPIPHRDYYRLLAFFHNITDAGTKGLTRKIGDPPIDVLSVKEFGSAPTYVHLRGNPRATGDSVKTGFPEVLSDGKDAKPGRLAFADWLTDARNPLTARVMMNRLWQHHFGRGIVPTPNDFGKLGEPPTHPELLDWLAAEFMHPAPPRGEGQGVRGWSIKRMHRLILASNAYRMSSKATDHALRVDPANTLFWRFNMRRLSSEEVRDSILAVSGKLNLKMAGPSIYPPIPKEVLAGQSKPGNGWRVSPPEEASRRSVYIFVKRSLQVPILTQFDQADTDASCPVRFTTTVPTQALGMLNGEFTNEQASFFAQRLLKDAPEGLEAQVRRAVRLTTGRNPSPDEVKADMAFVQRLRDQSKLSEQEALRFLCLVMLNANEFIYLD
jgi:cytochrome c553